MEGVIEMKDLKELIAFRKQHPFYGWGDNSGGYFKVASPVQRSVDLHIIVSNDNGWDHVSVSLEHRCPTWAEMDFVKRMCFYSNEVVMQLHPAENNHINNHPFCLHLWRPQTECIPLPPENMV